MASCLTILLAIFLCVWLAGVMYALLAITDSGSGSTHPSADKDKHLQHTIMNHTTRDSDPSLHTLHPTVSSHTTIHLRHPQHSKQTKQQEEEEEEELGNEVMREILNEALVHPVEKGERSEWQSHAGVGRKEHIFDDKKKSLRGPSSNSHSQPIKGTKEQSLTQTSALRQVSSRLISRSKGVTVTCDTRGNLGPCSVVNQSKRMSN
jgi:hypothetical protein